MVTVTNRFHLPVTVITDDELSKEQTRQYVQAMLNNLVDSDGVLRVFVEADGLDDAESERLRRLLRNLNEDDLEAAAETIDHILEEDE